MSKKKAIVNDFTFITGGANWTVDSSNKTCNGASYTRRAKSGGKGTTTKRAISFHAASAGKLIVHAMSGGSTNRNLTLNYNGSDIQSCVTVPSTVKELVFALPGAGHYILYPSDDNVGIYYMKTVNGSYAVPSPAPSSAAPVVPTKTPTPSVAVPSPSPSNNVNPVTEIMVQQENTNQSWLTMVLT